MVPRSYLDSFWSVNYPFNVLLFLVCAFLMDFVVSVIFHHLFVISFKGLFPSIMRLVSMGFALFGLSFFYYKLNSVLEDFSFSSSEDFSEEWIVLRKKTFFLNNLSYHILSGFVANVMYLVMLFSYVFPVLSWSPAHVFLNTFWVGVLGVGCYAFICGIRFMSDFFGVLKVSKVIDPLHEDEMGGLSPVMTLAVETVVFLSVAMGLWIGSIPYAFSYHLFLIMLSTGLGVGIFSLGYGLYRLHRVLVLIKNTEIKKYLLAFQEIKSKYISLGSEASIDVLMSKVDLMFKMLLSEHMHERVIKLKTWPFDYSMLLKLFGAAIGYLPAILRYLPLLQFWLSVMLASWVVAYSGFYIWK